MEGLISLIYVICGLSYTIFAGNGRYFAFIFGLTSSILYAFLSFKNALWGSFILNFFYYIPIQILSLIKWHENTNKNTKSVYKTELSLKKFLLYVIAALILSCILSLILYFRHDTSPVFDGFITVFSVLGAYFTFLRTVEQWTIWTIVNILTVVMWIILNNFVIVLLWLLYLILGIIFYLKWKKEIKSDEAKM